MASKADGRGAEAPQEHHPEAEAKAEKGASTETEATPVVLAQYHEARR